MTHALAKHLRLILLLRQLTWVGIQVGDERPLLTMYFEGGRNAFIMRKCTRRKVLPKRRVCVPSMHPQSERGLESKELMLSRLHQEQTQGLQSASQLEFLYRPYIL